MKEKTLPEKNSAKISLWQPAVIIIMVFIVYGNSLKNGFVYDDSSNIVENGFIKDWKNFPQVFSSAYFSMAQEKTYRPVVTLSYFIDYSLFKLKAGGWRFTNVLFYALNGILVYVFVLGLTAEIMPALFTALLFCLHPVQAEAINVVSFREDIVSFSFFIGALLLCFKSTQTKETNKVTYVFSVILSFLAVFSKEMALTLPFVLIAYDCYFRNPEKQRFSVSILKKNLHYYAGYLAVVVFYFIQKAWLLKPVGQVMRSDLAEATGYLGGSIHATAFTMMRTVVYYFGVLLLPLKLTVSRAFEGSTGFDNRVLLAAVVLTVTVILALRLNRHSKQMGFAVLFFFVTFIPVSNIIPIGAAFAERYMYFPSLGFCLLAVLALKWLYENKSKQLAIGIICSMLFFYSARAIIRNADFKDEFTLWSKTIVTNPASEKAYNNRGIIYTERKEYDKAIADFSKAIELNPAVYEIHNNRGKAYALLGEIDKAEGDFRKAIELKPGYEPARVNLRIILNAGKGGASIEKKLAQEIEMCLLRGTEFMEKQLLDEALKEYDRAIELAPGYAESYNKRGIVYGMKKNYEKAILDFSKAISLNPSDYMAYGNRSIAYKAARKNELAAKDAEMAKKLTNK